MYMRRMCAVVFMMCAPVVGLLAERPQVLRHVVQRMNAESAAGETKSVKVDCMKGQRIQEAIDKNVEPIVIDVHGICVEDVRVDRKIVTLRGANPLTDGVQGIAEANAAITFSYVNGARLENLSLSNGPGLGVSFLYTEGIVINCRITGNARSGVLVTAGSNVTAEALISTGNRNGAVAQRGGLFQCIGCTLSGNIFWAAQGNLGGIVSLGNSVITGGNGIFASYDGYAEMYCDSLPCGLNASGIAVWGNQRGTAALFNIGDFTGKVWGDANGETQIVASNQTSTADANIIDDFATLSIDSGKLSTRMEVGHFGRVVMLGSATVAGRIDCRSAGDVWLDPSVTVQPGVTITGCEHAAAP